MNGQLGRVMIFTASGQVPRDLKDAIDGRLHTTIVNDKHRWQFTDFYITRAGLNAKLERAAARMGATPVVWPEGRNFLISRIDGRCFVGEDVWLYLPGQAGDAI